MQGHRAVNTFAIGDMFGKSMVGPDVCDAEWRGSLAAQLHAHRFGAGKGFRRHLDKKMIRTSSVFLIGAEILLAAVDEHRVAEDPGAAVVDFTDFQKQILSCRGWGNREFERGTFSCNGCD